MNFWELFYNPVLIVPGVAWLIAQILKTVINALVHRKLSFSRLVGDGGMPSGHSATVMALALMCAFEVNGGLKSIEFAIAMILAIIVMHDAMGVRRETGKQAVSIISIVTVINDYIVEKDEQIKTDKLKVLVGHSPLQVVCGAVLGITVTLFYQFVIK